MTLRRNQQGTIGAIEIILVLVLTSASAFTVWRVNDIRNSSDLANQDSITASEVEDSIADGASKLSTLKVIDVDGDGIPLCNVAHEDSLDSVDGGEVDEVDELDNCESEDSDHDFDNDGKMDDYDEDDDNDGIEDKEDEDDDNDGTLDIDEDQDQDEEQGDQELKTDDEYKI